MSAVSLRGIEDDDDDSDPVTRFLPFRLRRLLPGLLLPLLLLLLLLWLGQGIVLFGMLRAAVDFVTPLFFLLLFNPVKSKSRTVPSEETSPPASVPSVLVSVPYIHH
jgi:hypothetical protein